MRTLTICLGLGKQFYLRDLDLHRDRHKAGRFDLLGLDGLELRLVAGNHAKQER